MAIYEEFPDPPSYVIPQTKLLPERSNSIKTVLQFRDSIPIACFCDRPTCKANVKSIQSPVIGLLKRDGQIVTSLEIKASQGELMYIILIDTKSIVADGSYLERTSYWQLADGQHQVLPGVPFDIEITRQISVSILKQTNPKFNFDTEIKNIAITALETSSGLSIASMKESRGTSIYRHLPSEVSRAIGVYQLIYEFVIYPEISLMNYITNQTTGAQCTSYIFKKEKCGFLLLLPAFLQRTPIFRQVGVDLEAKKKTVDTSDRNSDATEQSRTIAEGDQTLNKSGLSRRIIVIIISVSIVAVLLVVLAVILWRCNRCRHASFKHQSIPTEDDENQERTMKKSEPVLSMV